MITLIVDILLAMVAFVLGALILIGDRRHWWGNRKDW